MTDQFSALTVHQFSGSLQRGELGEVQLNAFFGKYWRVYPATREQQKQGIDCSFYDANTGAFSFTVEYKFDRWAGKTGNAFIELGSFGAIAKIGWSYTCGADYLFYCVADDLLVYAIRPTTLRRAIPAWLQQYGRHPKSIANNKGGVFYNTIGILIPLRELEAIAEQIISM